MIHVAYFDPDGRISSVSRGAAAEFAGNPYLVKITSAQYKTVERTHRVDIKTKKLIAGAIANPNPKTMQDVRLERDRLLAHQGLALYELLLPDSYPKLTHNKKKAKIAAIIKYRQALRDITTQADPDNITWPTPPGGI